MSKSSSLLAFAAASTFGLLAGASADAAGVPGQQYFAIGGGGGMLANGQPCPDLPCNGTDVCSCINASGNVSFSTTSKEFPPGTFTLELSADKSTNSPNGIGGQCYGSGGYMVLTTPRGTLNLQISGPACRIGTAGGGPEAAPFGISIPASIISGTGHYANPLGVGTLAASFDPVSKTVLIDLVGYGILNRPSTSD